MRNVVTQRPSAWVALSLALITVFITSVAAGTTLTATYRDKYEEIETSECGRPGCRSYSIGNTSWTKYVTEPLSEEADDELWALTAIFDASGKRGRKTIYDRFRQSLKYAGVHLMAVEVRFQQDHSKPAPPYLLSAVEDAEILLQGTASDVMWLKERMVNIGLAHLPPSCTKVVVIDSDIRFITENWVHIVKAALDKYPVLQPFNKAKRLLKGEEEPCMSCTDHDIGVSGVGGGNFAKMAQIATSGRKCSRRFFPGFSGYVHAFQRDFIDRHGLFDRAIVGSGDILTLFGAIAGNKCLTGYTKLELKLAELFSSEGFEKFYLDWAMDFYKEAQNRIGNADVNIIHYYHGNERHRGYGIRHKMLKNFGFDPTLDLKEGANMLLEWSDTALETKKRLPSAVNDYFNQRRETFKIVQAASD